MEERELLEEIDRLRRENRALRQTMKELEELKDHYRETARDLKAARERMKQLSITDDLTEIYNYRYFMEALDLELRRAIRYEYPISLMMVDIDHFKTYNDTHGHVAGDRVLREIARVMKATVRHTDILARYGGEEFAGILIKTKLDEACQIAERVRRAVKSRTIEHEGSQPAGRLTVSIGISTLTSQVSSVKGLIETADEALYEAKRKGRNRVAISQSAISEMPTWTVEDQGEIDRTEVDDSARHSRDYSQG
ncbi:MAG: GGDEF domain-containing protein [Deltaproteobacteria bacterium]|nr:GGDEF domain-containing protein [Deltaproteobacteria bacterium]MBW2121635.1 GGDEF domain-containing protein [Deltaproteobacteria bacterium]